MVTKMSQSNKKNYGDYDFLPIREARLRKESDKPIKIRGHIFQIGDSLYKRKKDFNDNFESRAIIADEYDKISTTKLSPKQFLKLKDYQEKGKSIIILGKIVRIPAFRKPGYVENAIKIKSYKVTKSPLSIIAAKKEEKKLAKKFIKIVKDKKLGVFHSLKEATVEEYGIGLEDNELLSNAIDVAIIQAFSCGRVQNTSGKINTLIIGGSGCGKKLIWYTAKLTNIISGEAQAGRISAAGLTADLSKQNVDGSIKLGLIPKANKGIAGFEDFDKCPNKEILYPIISPVMENGVCKITVRENLELEAETAIHLDVNQKSSQTVAKTGVEAIIDDIGMKTYMLSRFDYISYLPSRDDHDEDEKEPTKNSKIHKFCRKNNIDFERFIKVLVSYILNKYGKIDISVIREYKIKKFNEMIDAYDVKQIFSSYRNRMKNSRDKFINALTRLQLRKSGNKRAVNLTINYLSDKMKFLEILNQDSKAKSYEKGEAGFVRWVYDTFGEKKFSIDLLIKKYKKMGSPCGKVVKKTIYNWLNKYADSKKHDEWQLKKVVIYRLS
jgi:hypothetical protein